MVEPYNERGIIERRSVSLEEWLPDSHLEESYAVFGGDMVQRDITVEQGIARAFAHRTILVLHNNPSLEAELKNLIYSYPELAKYQNKPMAFVNYRNQNYMPFWGLNENKILEALYPERERNQSSQYRSGVRSYLKILKYGQKPYTLSNLLRLCNKNIEQLEQEELCDMPAEMADELLANLMAEGVMLKVRNDIESFAGEFRSRIWDGEEENVVNLLSAVKKQALVSIHLPVNSRTILDYLAVELELILESGIPCLLVIDSVDIEDGRMKRILQNPSVTMAKIIAGGTMQSVCSRVEHGGEEILPYFRKILLFKCANPVVAKQYSEMIGSYLRTVVSETHNDTKRPFSWLPVRTKGSTVSQQLTARMEPDELANLGDGAVLINQESGRIEKALRIEELE